jgi:hypothetical protein
METTTFTTTRTAPRSIDQDPVGPGWHDSSWDLRTGLDVIEDLPLEALPPEWQKRLWLSASANA